MDEGGYPCHPVAWIRFVYRYRALTDLEKSLFTVDELTGIITAASLMRPAGITSLTVKSLLKKFKDKRFAGKM